jgi:hypothetical protein
MRFGNVMKTSTYVAAGLGAAGGVMDVIAANKDAQGIAAAVADGKKLSMFKQYGTYVNYVVPLVEVGAVVGGVVDGEIATAMITSASQLAASKIARNMTTYPFGSKKTMSLTYSATPSAYTRERAAGRTNWAPSPYNAPTPTMDSPVSGVVIDNRGM